MKKYCFLFLLFFGLNVQAQIVNIPDPVFKSKLISQISSETGATDINNNSIVIDINNDGEVQASEALEIYGLYSSNSNITDITGINSFTNVRSLYFANCQITFINFLNLNNLNNFYINNNPLTSVNINGLSSLLEVMLSVNSTLTTCNISNCQTLYTIEVNSCGLTSLNLNNCPNLQTLRCDNNQLTSLDLSNLNTTQQPFYLKCYSNLISNFNYSGLLFGELDCSYNQLTSLNLAGQYSLNKLRCYNNNISTLYLNDSPLTVLQCSSNNLASLFMKNGFAVALDLNFASNPNLEFICTDDFRVSHIQSMCNSYGYSNCVVNSYCSFGPGGHNFIIEGNNRIDLNTDGCDVDDSNYPNVKFSIANGIATGTLISNTEGNYSIPVQAGSHTITPVFENPSYFTASPTSVTVSFPTTTSPYIQDFCISANGVKNDLEVTVIPIDVARPGFNAHYKVIYKNKGNQLANGTLNFSFNDAIMDLLLAIPVIDGSGSNSLSWNYANLTPFETREINLTFNINSPMETPAVIGGDVLSYTATIIGATDETPNDNLFTLNQTVVNSYDPNDKTCLEGTAITPGMVGEYVHYVIRFENTGTFAAENIVVKDMIDTTKFDISTLVPLSGSHSYMTRITNTNQVEFVFENIDLPFDNANNDGYVAFKIKTNPTLVLGDTFSNSANIYFDYNFPIVTNTATTTIQALGNQNFEFNSMFSLSPVPTKNLLTITTKEAIVMSSVNIYNSLGQLVHVNANPSEVIDVSGLQNGSYFIKITSDKGSASGKFIKE